MGTTPAQLNISLTVKQREENKYIYVESLPIT